MLDSSFLIQTADEGCLGSLVISLIEITFIESLDCILWSIGFQGTQLRFSEFKELIVSPSALCKNCFEN